MNKKFQTVVLEGIAGPPMVHVIDNVPYVSFITTLVPKPLTKTMDITLSLVEMPEEKAL